MIYSVNFKDLAETINPFAFDRYLKDTGWILFPSKRTNIKVYQITVKSGNAFQVVIPMDKSLSDFKEAIYQAVKTVAEVEGQSTEQLLLYLLNPNTDIIKIRLNRKGIESGSILFDDAIRVFENAKKLIVATAQDILHPRRNHQGRPDDSISKFINNCKFGQTEIGSYIISVVCPFAELDTDGYRQLSIFSDEERCAKSLTRQVTNRIMNNVSTIRQHIDDGEADKLIADDAPTVISSNFFDALSGLNLETDDTDVEFIAQWSPVVKTNRSTSNRIMISHDHYQPITDIISKLKANTQKKTRLLGQIKKLESAPDVAKRTSGKITVVCLDSSGNKKTVTANLQKEDYDKAIRAHQEGNYVELIGDLSGAKGKTLTCESFNVIE